jgi:PAS domain S-box-containing protein
MPSGDRRTRLLPARALHPAPYEELAGFGATLVCSLSSDLRTGPRIQDGITLDSGDQDSAAQGSAGPDGGAPGALLLVAADERVLAAMQDAVEVLVAQASLALERIALTDAVNRRDSDRYVHSVVRNTADVVLIVDETRRVRYASPSLAMVLGVELPPFASLSDLVHPDDFDQVTRTLGRTRRGDSDGTHDTWNLRRRDGRRVLVEVSYRDLRHDRMVRGFVLTMRDITERRRHEQEMIRYALQSSPAGQNRRKSADKFR